MYLKCANCHKEYWHCSCGVVRDRPETPYEDTFKKYIENTKPGKVEKVPEIHSTNVAVKHDTDKNRIDLIPPELIFALGDILTDGASKYSEHNWAKGMRYSRVFGACMRHLWQWWWTGEPDKESGRSHLWHACACIAFLIAYEIRKVGEDDRQIQTPAERPFR